MLWVEKYEERNLGAPGIGKGVRYNRKAFGE
jgi:hypothetical protein